MLMQWETVFNIGGNKYRLVVKINYRQGFYSAGDDSGGMQKGLAAMNSSLPEVDRKRYGRLLARKLPTVIRTAEENERMIQELEELDQRHDQLSPAESEYYELLTVLIGAFEEANYALDGSTPDSRLHTLMEKHGLRQKDLLSVFGSRGIASEVVSGKRAISKAKAKKLAQRFHVPADLFL